MASQTTFLPAVVTIADLPLGTTPSGGELIEVVQTSLGVPQSVQLTLSQAAGVIFPIDLASNATGVLPAANMTSHFFPVTPLPVGGVTTLGLTLSSAASFGIFAGTGLPTLAAGTGSLYLRFDGSNATSRLYVNTNGSTNWTAILAAG